MTVRPPLHEDRIIGVLNAHEVAYVVIGAVAAQVHGAPIPRTQDIDITPARDAENLERLSAALSELGACIRTDSEPEGLAFAHNSTSLAGSSVWNLTCSAGDFDLAFLPSGFAGGYDDLVGRAQSMPLGGERALVADLDDVIHSKREAGRPKDWTVLPVLLATSRSRRDPEGPSIDR